MLDLEKIKRRLEMRFPDGFVGVAVDSGAQWVRDIRALVAEVERLKPIVSTFIETGFVTGLSLRPDITAKELRHAADLIDHDAIMPCSHPRSAIVSNVCDELISHYCGTCNAEAEAEVRRDDRAMVEMGGPLEMREEEVRY